MSTTTDIHSQVQTHYGAAAKDTSDGTYGERVAREFGYSKEELENVPQESNLGLSCGNPFAIANLKEGETVVDLGSGAGFDVFQAAKKVGSTGKAIGIDQNEEMLTRANRLKSTLPPSASAHISFLSSPITALPLPSASADCIISNCVINLVPDAQKPLVFNEMFRVLRPGGRVAVSDILAKGPMPQRVKDSVAMWVGCFAGASLVSEYEGWLREAGFKEVLVLDSGSDLNVYRQADGTQAGCCAPSQVVATSGTSEPTAGSGCCGPKKGDGEKRKPAQAQVVDEFGDLDFNGIAGSYKIFAVKG